MKSLLPATLAALLIGGAIGYALPGVFQTSDLHVGNTKIAVDEVPTTESTENAELLEANEKLKQQLEALKHELDRMTVGQAELDNQLLGTNEPSEAQIRKLKKDWIEQALLNRNPRDEIRREREVSKMMNRLGLTIEQATTFGLLADKRDQQRQLRLMQSMGLISKEDYDTMFAEINAFDFDLAFNSVLSPDQQDLFGAMKEESRNQGVQRISTMMADRLQLSNDRFSDAERAAINSAMKTALSPQSGKVKIPPAIRELEINQMDKRILATGFEKLDPDTFEKLYQSVVEQNESGDNSFTIRNVGGGKRGGKQTSPPIR